jgi:hypothetical protein
MPLVPANRPPRPGGAWLAGRYFYQSGIPPRRIRARAAVAGLPSPCEHSGCEPCTPATPPNGFLPHTAPLRPEARCCPLEQLHQRGVQATWRHLSPPSASLGVWCLHLALLFGCLGGALYSEARQRMLMFVRDDYLLQATGRMALSGCRRHSFLGAFLKALALCSDAWLAFCTEIRAAELQALHSKSLLAVFSSNQASTPIECSETDVWHSHRCGRKSLEKQERRMKSKQCKHIVS